MATLPSSDVQDRVEAFLIETEALRAGKFLLSSGKHSDRYCQCARLFEHPESGRRIAGWMADLMRAHDAADVHAVVAPALGGVLWGYDLAAALGVRSIFVERVNGAFALRRGFELRKGMRVAIAEDVVTTGGSVMEVIPVVESHGASVACVSTVVDRSRGSFKPGVPAFSLVELEFEVWDPEESPFGPDEVERPGSRTASGSGDASR
ncbi:MAG: orotate phosphoribosyltransferase [Phycisphaerales bacterium]